MRYSLLFALALCVGNKTVAQTDFHVIAFYTKTVEQDHVDFANDAIRFFADYSKGHHFSFDTTTHWENHTREFLSRYQLVLWLNEFPHTEEERRAFEDYMENGGGWIGFHVSGYNDKDTHWPWFVEFMGGAVFNNNNWPPLAAKLRVDTTPHPVTRHVPSSFISPINEWYQWKPSPRLNKDIVVLLSLDSSNYPLGKKHSLTGGDVPVMWVNTRYRMLYMNMGHGDKVMSDPVQNRMIGDAVMWVGKLNTYMLKK